MLSKLDALGFLSNDTVALAIYYCALASEQGEFLAAGAL